MAQIPAQLEEIDRATLTPLVRLMTAREGSDVIDWQIQPLQGGGEVSSSLYRVAGQARDGAVTLPWSVVLKILRAELEDACEVAEHWYSAGGRVSQRDGKWPTLNAIGRRRPNGHPNAVQPGALCSCLCLPEIGINDRDAGCFPRCVPEFDVVACDETDLDDSGEYGENERKAEDELHSRLSSLVAHQPPARSTRPVTISLNMCASVPPLTNAANTPTTKPATKRTSEYSAVV